MTSDNAAEMGFHAVSSSFLEMLFLNPKITS
jgi:hypothetical protein